ncbi:ArsR/SmtB family transcription factor [Pseudactinotalea terrae]|uniref:ArsR/SmtB family transcription factor n=1 Tax=Pseudactinotalea terrae TaxID=1743262 RepID=UPI0012E30CB4|nr:metalloregulator ArsR/SmtB family transcription factor [Pseudactinotalea terrae]
MAVTFEALAHPVRQDILAELRARPRTVNELVDSLRISQPLASKHLRVLRDAGFVVAVPEAQKRRYALRPEAFAEVAQWLEPYRWMWEDRLDLLGAQLDEMKEEDEP